ncbi:MAG: hypothetical protein J1F31_03040 [Erysipelotrichales bacterium]|nr:hypothetical protein [Erysipelotrichales bacterium]
MKKRAIILGLSLFLLSACGEGTSTSDSASKGSNSNSTSASTSSSSVSSPSASPSLGTSESTSNSTPGSTSNSTTGSTSNSSNDNSSNLPEVAEKSIRFTADSLEESLSSSYVSEETTVSADGMEIGFMSVKYGTYSGAGYLMFNKTGDDTGAGHMYNKTSLGHISSIVVKFSASTSEAVTMGVTFGDNILNEAKTTYDISETATRNTVVTFTNIRETGDYFNISVTNNKNLQIVEMVINLNGANETIDA